MVHLENVSFLHAAHVASLADRKQCEKFGLLFSVIHFLSVACLVIWRLVLQSQQISLAGRHEILHYPVSVTTFEPYDFACEIDGQAEIDGGFELELVDEGNAAPPPSLEWSGVIS